MRCSRLSGVRIRYDADVQQEGARLRTMDTHVRQNILVPGLADVLDAWRDRRVWMLSAAVSVGARYRQTVLGPWWSTLVTAAFIGGLAVLRVGLGEGDLRQAIPYVGFGFIVYFLISSGVGAGANVFISSGARLSSVKRPLSFYAFQTQAVQVLNFLHDAVVLVVIAIVFAIPLTLAWGQSVAVVALIVIGAFGITLWLGPLVARFRDLQPIVQVFLRLALFLTPIFWSINDLADGRGDWAWFNPFTYLVLAFRDPILQESTQGAPIDPFLFAVLWAVVNIIVGLVVFSFTRRRIPYWVVE